MLEKSDLPPGPWQDEPDREEWRSHGFPCLIVRGPIGALCGYVAVEPGHPWHGKGYRDVDAEVHGSLTYANACQEDGEICHVPGPGERADVWWLGFDCSHAYDKSPLMSSNYARSILGDEPGAYGTYRDIAYVRGEVERLAEQAAAASKAR